MYWQWVIQLGQLSVLGSFITVDIDAAVREAGVSVDLSFVHFNLISSASLKKMFLHSFVCTQTVIASSIEGPLKSHNTLLLPKMAHFTELNFHFNPSSLCRSINSFWWLSGDFLTSKKKETSAFEFHFPFSWIFKSST